MIATILSYLGCKKDKSDFGNYEKPQILQKLEDYQKKEKANWENLEFWIDYERYYSITPIDVIPFASTGNNGIHFGFLTDFGKIKDLEKAPIVAIAPTYDPPINIIAKNIEQFLSFVAYSEQASLLADIYENEKAFEFRKNQYLEWQMEEKHVLKRKKTIELLKKDFGIEKENKVISKINTFKNERKKIINTETSDGIGLVLRNNEKVSNFEYNKDSKKVKEFLDNSNLNSRLKFYREATFQYILSDDYDKEIKKLIVNYLEKDGLKKESEIIKKL